LKTGGESLIKTWSVSVVDKNESMVMLWYLKISYPW